MEEEVKEARTRTNIIWSDVLAANSLCHAKNSLLPMWLPSLGVALHPEEKLAFQTVTEWSAQMFSL